MSSDTTYKTTSTAAAATEQLGKRLAAALPDGSVVVLMSDLGGGKTTLVKGLAAGLGVTEPVTSPTFTLSRVYPLSEGRELHHFDLYRLGGGDIVVQELDEVVGRPGTITAIEWPEVAAKVIPKDHLTVTLVATGLNDRQITIDSHGPKASQALAQLEKVS